MLQDRITLLRKQVDQKEEHIQRLKSDQNKGMFEQDGFSKKYESIEKEFQNQKKELSEKQQSNDRLMENLKKLGKKNESI